jgi:hypothetical protein
MGSKMGILRYIVVGAVAFALLPTPPVSENKQGEALPPVAKLETHELLSAAIGTVADCRHILRPSATNMRSNGQRGVGCRGQGKVFVQAGLRMGQWPACRQTVARNGDSNGISGLLQQPVAPAQAKPAPAAGLKQSAADPLVTGSTTRVAETTPEQTRCGSTT